MVGMEVMSYRRARFLMIASVALLAVALALIALRWVRGDEDGTADRPEVPATNRAMAAMILDRIPREYTSKGDNWALRDYPKGSIGAIVNFDSDVLALSAVATPDLEQFERYACGTKAAKESYDGCRQERVDDGSMLRTSWDLVTPEEDPGLVTFSVRRDDQVVRLTVSGPDITGDPAKTGELPLDVDTFVDLVTDPAFGLRTSQRYVDQGEAFDSWGGGGL